MMNRKRILALLCAIMMLMPLFSGYAEAASGQTLYYTGGVVFRVLPRDADSELLQVAYTLTDMPYIVLNKPYEWDVIVGGGTGTYNIEAALAFQTMDLDPFQHSWSVIAFPPVIDNVMEYTFTQDGRYFWQFTISDSAGQSIVFQTRIYEAYSEADETDPTTTVGKANAIVDELITDDMSDYSRALVLHDWLIYNANYDYTYTNYDASGVLLLGSGVCDSYARAYLMLCTAAGLECMYVGGTAGQSADKSTWGNHGWNLVKLGGSWYHVDCTWDDPGEGGYECHDYFCLSDEAMAKDHRWNRPDDMFDTDGMLVPDAEGGEYEPEEAAASDYDFTFSTWDEFGQKFDELVAAGERRYKTVGRYTGTKTSSDMYTEMADWAQEKSNKLSSTGLITSAGRGYRGSLFYFRAVWNEPTAYLRIDEESLRVSLGEKRTIIPSEIEPETAVYTWTSSDPSIATVSAVYDEDSDLLTSATVTGVGAGTATITATSEDGITDSFTVTVLPPHAPDFSLKLSETASGVEVSWNSIPGVTGYDVMRAFEGTATLLATTTDNSVVLSAQQLPANVCQTVYVVARRTVSNNTMATYTSPYCAYGKYTFVYDYILPAETTTIEAEAFAGNTSLTAADIDDQVTTIGSRAFADCTSLNVVRIPASVTSIANDAFSGSPLRYAVVPEGSAVEEWMTRQMPNVHLVH